MNKVASPLPLPDKTTESYWQACRDGELRLQRCRACGVYLHFPGTCCSQCGGADLYWNPVSGQGTVYSFVVVHQTTIAYYKSKVPYVVAWIELEEGPSARVLSDLIDWDGTPVHIGDRVQLEFDRSSPEFTIPRFRLRR